MKRTASVLLLLAALSTTSFAQDRPARLTPEQRAERQTEMMDRMLTLTPEQRTMVYEVNKKNALNAGNNGGFRANQESRDLEYKQILTEDQYRKYEEIKSTRQENGRRNRDVQGRSEK